MTSFKRFLVVGLLAAPLSMILTTLTPSVASAATAGFHAITPTRALDTRGVGALQPGETRNVRIVGVGGVPATATAVALNVTATGPDNDGFFTVSPAGAPVPGTSNLNFVYNQTVANMVTTGLGTGGDISLTNSSIGATEAIVDVAGWYDGGFHPIAPTRIVDTRNNLGGATVGTGEIRNITVGGVAGVPASAVAVALNVTAVMPSAAGFVTVYPTGVARPDASNLNFVAGQIVPNMVTVGLGTGGAISLFNATGSTNVLVDVTGYFVSALHPVTPARIMDTRADSCMTKLGPGETRLVAVAGKGGVPANAGAVSLNVTAVNPTTQTFLTLWPSGQARPNASNLNPIAGVVPNMVTVGLGTDGRVALYNDAGVVDVLIDVTGWYDGSGSLSPNSACETVGQKPSTATNGAEVVPGSDLPIRAAKYGSSSDNVANIQQRLLGLGYWVDEVDGNYGYVTYQAVMAFQKYMGLPRTGSLGEWDAFLLSMQGYKPIGLSRTGDLAEVDKGRQLLFIIRGGKTVLTVNTSTGSDVPYTEVNQRDGGLIEGDAHTPIGRFKIYHSYTDGWESGQLGELYRPRYFNGGIAVHGAPNIPSYPASHGCVRVTTTFMDFVWHNNILPMGGSVWVHN